MSEGSAYGTSSDHENRRQYARTKINVPVELQTEESESPIRGATTDLSVGGCYIETIFPFPVGTALDLQLQIPDNTVPVSATVVTCDPQVGNGIRFEKMLPEDREALEAYLKTLEQENKSP